MSEREQIIDAEPQLARTIANAIAAARESGHSYILPKTPEQIATALGQGRAAVVGADGERRYYGQLTELSPRVPHIVEFGGLVRFGGEGGGHRASDVVRDALQLPFAAGKLVIATVRSQKSQGALSGAGMAQVEWGEFPNIRAVTCDPTCAPGPEAGMLAWVACGQGVECNACSISLLPAGREDACSLMGNDVALAKDVESGLNAQFGGDALALRRTFGLDLGVQ